MVGTQEKLVGDRSISATQRLALCFGIVPLWVAATASLGWAFNIEALRNPFQGQPPVAISTAICLLAGCLAGLIVIVAGKSRRSAFISKAAGWTQILVSGSILLNYTFRWMPDLDQAIMRGALDTAVGFSPGRMAPSTAACFFLLAIAIVIGARTSLTAMIWHGCIGLTVLVASTICVGYAYNASLLYGIGIFTPMALPTALSVICLCSIQIATHRSIGLMKLLCGQRMGSFILRRLLPALVVIPLVLGYLRILGERAGLYDDSMGTALYALLMIVCCTAIAIRQAAILNRLTEQHERSGKAIELLYSDLVQTRDAALESARLKSEFLANMSHEIRTPMNAVIGCADMLQRTRLSSEQTRFVELIIASGHALMAVIDDILILSKLEAGKLELGNVEVNLVDLTESAGQLLAEKARTKKLSLTTYVAPDLNQIVLGDPQRLRQILLNLLGNAVKFTEHGHVSLRADLHSEDQDKLFVKFTVSDTGMGITEEIKNKLFEPFCQGDGSVNRKYGGTGLGLAISRRLVRMMEGDIFVDSIHMQGATFTVLVPLGRANGASGKKEELLGVRLLVVGVPGNEFEVCKSYCQSWGIQADYAPGSQSAMYFLDTASVTRKPYQLILVDHSMEGIDAHAFRAMALERRLQPTPKFVMLTQLDEVGQYEEALLKGFSAVLTKPLRQSELFDCIMGLTTNLQQMVKDAIPRLDGFSCALPRSFSKQILVVEDNEINQEVLSMQLKAIGFEPILAENGAKAIELLKERRFGLILMDCQMPVLNGFETTKKIRLIETSYGYRTPIVAMTANSMEGDREACLDSGMDDYLGKPVTANKLKEIIEQWFLVALETDDQMVSQWVSTPLEPELTQMSSKSWSALEADFGEAAANQFLNLFIEQTPPLIGQIRRATAEEDEERLREAAHELKGSCYAIHCEDLAEIAHRIEVAARQRQWDNAANEIAELLGHFGEFTKEWSSRVISAESESGMMTNPQNIGVFLVEDNELTRLGIKAIFAKVADINVVGEAMDGAAAVTSILETNPDIVLLDIGLPSLNGIEVTRRIKTINPSIKALMLTAHDSDEDMFAAFAAGADGYVVKHSFDHNRLLLAVRTVASGCCWLDPLIAQRVLSVASKMSQQVDFSSASLAATVQPLSPGEETLLRRVAGGQPECEDGVCRVGPTFLANLNRFAKHQATIR